MSERAAGCRGPKQPRQRQSRAPSSTARRESNARRDLVLEELLNKAAQLFFDRGYANTRMQDIADGIGMSRPALYHYFKNKDEVLVALTEGDALSHVQSLEELVKDRQVSARDRLIRAIKQNIQSKLQGGVRFRFVDRIQSELPPRLVASFAATRRRVLDLTARIIEEGIARREFRMVDSKIAAFAVLGMSNWTAWWYSPEGRKTAPEIAQEMVDLVLRGLISGQSKAAPFSDVEAALDQLDKATIDLKRLVKSAPARSKPE